jgi:hypothetical protein
MEKASASNASQDEVSTPLSPSSGLSNKVSILFLRMPIPPTVVHRSELKTRPSLISINTGAGLVETVQEISPSTSAETSVNSGKSSVPENNANSGNSTGKTSQDSKFSLLAKKGSGQSQHLFENKKTVVKQPPAEAPLETTLMPIQEAEMTVAFSEPVPSKSTCS